MMEPCIIIDDEPKARVLLEAIIKDYCPQLQLMALCEDLPSGVKAIKKYQPSLVFLDIEMPGHSGLELLDFFNEEEVNFNVIFTTAYDEYAIQAFRFSAIDYLLKPIQHTQLVEAVERFFKRQDQFRALSFKTLRENLNHTTNWEDKRIAIPSGQSIYFFKPSDIILIKGEAAYSEIHLRNGNKLMVGRNLKHFETLLHDIPVFFRCHKSYIINRNEVREYIKSDGGVLVMSNGTQAALSVEKVAAFLEG